MAQPIPNPKVDAVRPEKIRSLTNFIKTRIGENKWGSRSIWRKIDKIKTRCEHPGLNPAERALCDNLLKTASGCTQQIFSLLTTMKFEAARVEKRLKR